MGNCAMDIHYVNPFIKGIKGVFSTMLDTDVTIGKPMAETNDDQIADTSAVVGITGDAVGVVVMGFPMKTAVNVASAFAGVEMSMDHEDFTDALGELVNMVTGLAKSKLEGLNCSISLPGVIIGREHIVSRSKVTPRLTLPCDSKLGRFCVEVGLAVTKPEARILLCEVT